MLCGFGFGELCRIGSLGLDQTLLRRRDVSFELQLLHAVFVVFQLLASRLIGRQPIHRGSELVFGLHESEATLLEITLSSISKLEQSFDARFLRLHKLERGLRFKDQVLRFVKLPLDIFQCQLERAVLRIHVHLSLELGKLDQQL